MLRALREATRYGCEHLRSRSIMLVGAPLLIFSLLVSGGSITLDAYSNTRLLFGGVVLWKWYRQKAYREPDVELSPQGVPATRP